MNAAPKYDVGGYLLDRPFRIRRLGHFQYFARNLAKCVDFYTRILGFQITDALDLSVRLPDPSRASEYGDLNLYFMRFGTDHHTFVISSPVLFEIMKRNLRERVTIGQITWQVGSLREVVNGQQWFAEQNIPILRAGRDTPGSNWHTYIPDPDGHTNEIYYGMEQIGWSGHSKPKPMYNRGFTSSPPLPQIPEYREIENAIAAGVDLFSGDRAAETGEPKYDVGGVLLPRPFKITGIGPVRMMTPDIDAALSFYCGKMGLRLTEEISWRGHRAVFLRCGNEHHSFALYDQAIGDELGLNPRTWNMSFGIRLNDFRQLRDAVGYLREQGVKLRFLPSELTPGTDYSVYAEDPEGHLVQLYCYMEQVGGDGRPRPRGAAAPMNFEDWPQTLEAPPDVFGGEQFFGPWG